MLTKRQKLRKHYKRAVNRLRRHPGNKVTIFIFGEMRSGTNMLADTLDLCPLTEVFHETDDEAFVDYVLKDNGELRRLVDRSPATHVVFKCIADSARARDLLDVFPGSKGLWIFRKYTDVVNSAMRKWQDHNRYLHDILFDEDRAAWRRVNMPDSHLALIKEHYERSISETSARALIWYVRNDMYFCQGLDSASDVHLINYEHLVRNPVAGMQSSFDFVGLPFSEKYTDHISPRSINRSAAPELDGAIEHLCRELLARFHDTLSSRHPIGAGAAS